MTEKDFAKELFKVRISAYWGNTEQMAPGSAMTGGKWRGSIGEDVAKKWYQECLSLARAVFSTD